MKAIVYREFGPPDVLRLEEVEKPLPASDEILIRARATPINYGDLTARNFRNLPLREFNMPLPLYIPTRLFFGIRRPKLRILGSEFAGEVEAIGKEVKRFNKGDRVFGYLGMKMGAYAEYLSISENSTVGIAPENMSYEEACTLPYGGIMASSLLEKAGIRSRTRVLINGASGGIGSMAVQLAKNNGAEVTGVCGTSGLEYVKSLGADKVIDYKKEDFTEMGEKYDLVFDILGKNSFSYCKNSLTENGVYFPVSFKTKELLQMVRTNIIGSKKVLCGLASEKVEYLAALKELAETGKIKTVVDHSYPLEETAEAHRYAEEGGKQGPVVITID